MEIIVFLHDFLNIRDERLRFLFSDHSLIKSEAFEMINMGEHNKRFKNINFSIGGSLQIRTTLEHTRIPLFCMRSHRWRHLMLPKKSPWNWSNQDLRCVL